MGLFSFLNKNKQDAAPGKSEYRSQSDEPFTNTRTRTKRSAAAGNAGNKESDDPMLPEKKRARRRLIGAVVLVLAVIIILPMILDPEPKPVSDDISVQIPSRDTKPTPVASRQPDAASLDSKEELVDNKPADKPAEIIPQKPAETAVAAPVAVASAVPAPTPVPMALAPMAKPAEKPNTAPVEKPAEHPLAVQAAAAEKAAKAEKAEKAEKAAAAAADAKRAAAAARPSEEERAMAILQGKPAAAAKPADKPGAYVPNGKFVIQVAALATQEKIDELRGKLSSAGLSSFTQKVATQQGDRTRIRVGPFESRAEAEQARAKILKLGLNASIVPT